MGVVYEPAGDPPRAMEGCTAAEPEPNTETSSWPPTVEEDEATRQAFVDAVDPSAVCQLAARLAGGRRHRLFAETVMGSFNMCFFVEEDSETAADTTRRVVRVPIGPAVYDAQAKVDSEVATMRYVALRTTIPVPHVHAAGHDADLARPGAPPLPCSYLVMDYMAAAPLDLEAFLVDTPARQRHLYGQLVDVLAQLRGLTFAAGGSLLSGAEAGTPVVGPLQSAGANELRRRTRGTATATPTTYRTATGFALAQLRTLQAAFAVPMASATLANLRMEAFALEDVGTRLVDVLEQVDEAVADGTGMFVLAHTDLHWENLLVDADLTVRAVLDWEWSAAVPPLFFAPPTWLAGPSPCYVASLAYERAYAVFFDVLRSRAAATGPTAAACRTLMAAWGPRLPARLDLPLVVILQQHHHLVPAYFFSVFPRVYDITHGRMPPALVARLLQADADARGPLWRSVRQRWRAAHAYRAELEARGCLVEYELAPGTRARLAWRDGQRARALVALQGQVDDDMARVLLESVLQASIQPRNFERVLGGVEPDTTATMCCGEEEVGEEGEEDMPAVSDTTETEVVAY